MIFDNTRYNKGQIAALEPEKGNVVVSASAGSGKTTVLTERIVRLIVEGKSIRRMAVMTFSKAAAEEMKGRIVKKLFALMRENLDDEVAERIRENLEAMPFATIGTIDGYCYSLVKKFFAVVGADPSAVPLEPDEGARMLEECIDYACEERIEDKDADFIGFAERYAGTRKLDDVKDLVAKLRGFLSVQPNEEEILSAPTQKNCERFFLQYAVGRTRKLIALVIGAANAGGAIREEEEQTGRLIEQNAVRLLDILSDETIAPSERIKNYFGALQFCVDPKKTKKKLDGKGNPVPAFVLEIYNGAVDAFRGYINNMGSFRDSYENVVGKQYGERDVKTLIRLVRRTEELYSERKKKAGKLDFGDMAHFAREILRDEEVARQVRESYDYIFVDEYQDTNYLQEELFGRISNDNVYVVGDVKQSIYHFRYAEPKIINDRMEEYDVHKTGQVVRMNKNYRSHPDILRFVNEVCSEVMTGEFCDIDYRAKDLMDAGDPAHFTPDPDAVRIYYYEPEKKAALDPVVYSVKDAEVEGEGDPGVNLVCDLVARELGTTLRFFDKGKEKTLVVDKKDVAVIVGTNRDCREIAESLEKRGISAFVADDAKGVFAPRELLVDFVRVSLVTNEISLSNVLLNGQFGFLPGELVAIRQKSPKVPLLDALKSYSGETKLEDKIHSALDYIGKLKDLGRVLKASDLMRKVLSDRLEGYVLSLGAGVATRIRRFVDAVSRMECDADLNDFLDYYDTAYEGDRPVSRENSVTIMTVHKSKGLEYPVVVVPMVHKKQVGNGGRYDKLLVDRELGIAIKNADAETGVAADNFATRIIKQKKKDEERQEMARCAYVAFTRAESRLLVVGEKQSPCTDIDAVDSFGDLLTYAAYKNKTDDLGRYVRTDFPPSTEILAETGERPDYEDVLEAAGKELFVDYPYAVDVSSKATVSELAEQEDFVPNLFSTVGRKGSAAKVGTAYHLVLQKIPLSYTTVEEIDAFVGELKKTGEIEGAIADELSAIKILDLLRTDVLTRAKGKEILREQPFVIPVERGGEIQLVQGVADLLIFEEEGVTVVDYKASGLDREDLKMRYAEQLEWYALAVRKIYKKPIKGKVLLNVLRGYEVEVP